MTTLIALVLSALVYLPQLRSVALPPPSTPPFDAEILRDTFVFRGQDAIDARRASVDARLTSMTLIYRDSVDSTEGGSILAYADGETIRKIVETYYLESAKYRTTYYYEEDGQPLSATTRGIAYNQPIYAEESDTGEPWAHATLDDEELIFADGDPGNGASTAEGLYKAALKSADAMKNGRYPRYAYRGSKWEPITTQ